MEVKSADPSQLTLTFFGLTSSEATTIRVRLFRQIHNIVFHSNGGYDWHTIYNMPIWLRKFTWKELDDYYKESDKKMKEATQGKKGQTNLINSDGSVNVPEFAKASQPYKGKSNYK